MLSDCIKASTSLSQTTSNSISFCLTLCWKQDSNSCPYEWTQGAVNKNDKEAIFISRKPGPSANTLKGFSESTLDLLVTKKFPLLVGKGMVEHYVFTSLNCQRSGAGLTANSKVSGKFPVPDDYDTGHALEFFKKSHSTLKTNSIYFSFFCK